MRAMQIRKPRTGRTRKAKKVTKPNPDAKVTNVPSTHNLLDMFVKVNRDCKEQKQSVVKFSDTDYYSGQIKNIFDCSTSLANKLSKDMAFLAKSKNVTE